MRIRLQIVVQPHLCLGKMSITGRRRRLKGYGEVFERLDEMINFPKLKMKISRAKPKSKLHTVWVVAENSICEIGSMIGAIEEVDLLKTIRTTGQDASIIISLVRTIDSQDTSGLASIKQMSGIHNINIQLLLANISRNGDAGLDMAMYGTISVGLLLMMQIHFLLDGSALVGTFGRFMRKMYNILLMWFFAFLITSTYTIFSISLDMGSWEELEEEDDE
ncbi:hypothetical protein ACJX0J_040252, partial [Zea mays]